jgi:hypothetical protein
MSIHQLSKDSRIAVIGLGYVGLPLAHAFGKLYGTIGFDINERRVTELKRVFDSNNELIAEQFEESINLEFSDKENCLQNYDIYIITAPTPVDGQHQPNLEPVKKATRLVASHLQMEKYRYLRIDGLSRSNGRRVRTITQRNFWTKLQYRFPCRLQPVTHQSRRHGTLIKHHSQSNFRLNTRGRTGRR